jgi:hypothetical protein
VAKKKKETSEKLSPEPKVAAARKRRTASPEPKALVQEETPATPSAAEVEEIMKVMTEPLPVKLSPLAPALTKFFQRDKAASTEESLVLPKNEELFK